MTASLANAKRLKTAPRLLAKKKPIWVSCPLDIKLLASDPQTVKTNISQCSLSPAPSFPATYTRNWSGEADATLS